MELAITYWRHKPAKTERLLALVLIVGLLTLQYSIAIFMRNSNDQAAISSFNTIIQNDTKQLSEQSEIYANTLYSARALLLTKSNVSQQDWLTFVDTQNIEQRYPAVYGLGYVQAVNSGKPDSQAVLKYLAPETTDQSVVGYNLFSDPIRSPMLVAARDTGLPRASAPLILIADAKHTPQSDTPTGFLIAMPIYNSTNLQNLSERQAAVTGFAVLAIHYKPLLDTIFNMSTIYGPIAVHASVDNQTIYQLGTIPKGTVLHKTVEINFAGQPWDFSFTAASNFGLSKTAQLAPVVALWSMIPFALILLLTFYFGINFWILRQQYRELEDKHKNSYYPQ